MTRVKAVYKFVNGCYLAFDYDGQQIPELQDYRHPDWADRMEAMCDEDIEFHGDVEWTLFL